MARTRGTEGILDAALQWRDRCLLADGSMATDRSLWTKANIQEVISNFVERPDTGDRSFMDKLQDQLAPASEAAKQLVAEMLWVLFLFPSNTSRQKKMEIITTVWGWSGDKLATDHPMLLALGEGIGSGGMGFNNYRPYELEFLVRFMEAWKAKAPDAQRLLLADPWVFAEFTDAIQGASKRQFRHMLLHLLFPDTFERIASKSDKSIIDTSFANLIADAILGGDEANTSLIARDRRLARIRERLEQMYPDKEVDFYKRPVLEMWRREEDTQEPPVYPPVMAARPVGEPVPSSYADLSTIRDSIKASGLRISDRTLRRYHLALHSRSFVILSGVSGSGKTWLAEEYAKAAGARCLVVPVAPNWTTNEDLLGFVDPFTKEYRDTGFSNFVREAAANYEEARKKGVAARDFHLVLDEMNLARVEYYFATFLSKMEQRMRDDVAKLDLGGRETVLLPPNLRFIGTVNIDETTHGFADKVFDRAQLIEIEAPRDALKEHLGAAPYADFVLRVWDLVAPTAPFAFRVLDDISDYVKQATTFGTSWEELLDELLLQKVLPKVRGTDPRVGDALRDLDALTLESFPLSHAKIAAMRARFEQQGIASYF